MKKIAILTLILMTVIFAAQSQNANSKLKALIIDGQNNHYIWPKTTMMMKSYLEQTGLFEVDISRSDTVWLGFKYNKSRSVPLEGYISKYPVGSGSPVIAPDPIKNTNYSANFDQYDLIVSNLGAFAAEWSPAIKGKFEEYMRAGGALVVVHAANNAWGDWSEFNKMIALGAWGDRDVNSGPYVYYDQELGVQKDPSEGICGSHGREHEYVVTSRAPNHPIMKGLPENWLHTQDELYDRMRGPFENATILATAFSDAEKNEQSWEPKLKGTARNVPTLMAIEYGKGRIFHTTLGHFDYSMECVGFITTLQRGAEWAATGAVTQETPKDFPGADKTSSRSWQD